MCVLSRAAWTGEIAHGKKTVTARKVMTAQARLLIKPSIRVLSMLAFPCWIGHA
jgi:hypothetical protein